MATIEILGIVEIANCLGSLHCPSEDEGFERVKKDVLKTEASEKHYCNASIHASGSGLGQIWPSSGPVSDKLETNAPLPITMICNLGLFSASRDHSIIRQGRMNSC